MVRVRVQVPATTANLGPGFDCLSLALGLYNEVTIESVEGGLEVVVEGTGSPSIPKDERNMVYRAARLVMARLGVSVDGFKIRVLCRIPPARGLGSSATAIVGGMLAANVLYGQELTRHEILELAGQLEPHPDNLAPALFGGFTVAVRTGDSVDCVCLKPPPGLRVAAAVPRYELSTDDARAVLPATVSHADAVFNVGRTALLVAGMAADKDKLFKAAMKDRLHHPYRAVLVPGLEEVLDAATEAGALGACLSGAGPTVVALCRENEQTIAEAMCRAFRENRIEADPLVLDVDRSGATLVEETGESDASG